MVVCVAVILCRDVVQPKRQLASRKANNRRANTRVKNTRRKQCSTVGIEGYCSRRPNTGSRNGAENQYFKGNLRTRIENTWLWLRTARKDG